MSGLRYTHADVFTTAPYSGNSVPVFCDALGLTGEQMQRITNELRHFEAIFLESTGTLDTVRARIFDLVEELPFAGHPIIGAAAVLHATTSDRRERTWRFQLAHRTVVVTTRRDGAAYFALLDQGVPVTYGTVPDPAPVARAFGLAVSDLHPDLPLDVISTGLSYLVVPVRPDVLCRARIAQDITPVLREVDARYAVLFDEEAGEIRHWTNDGAVEDTATGSAAGVIGAYRLCHGLTRGGETFVLRQGRFTGRPSEIQVRPGGTRERPEAVSVGGNVALVGHGVLEVLP